MSSLGIDAVTRMTTCNHKGVGDFKNSVSWFAMLTGIGHSLIVKVNLAVVGAVLIAVAALNM